MLETRKQFDDSGVVVRRSRNGRVRRYKPTADTDAARGVAVLTAQTDATAGDTILVYADALLDASLGKDGVNWWFSPGVTITNATTDVWSDGGSAMNFEVGGQGSFHNTKPTAGINTRVGNFLAASTVNISYKSAISNLGVAWRTGNLAATLKLDGDLTQSADGTFDNVGGTMLLFGRRAVSTAGLVLEQDGDLTRCYISELESGGSNPVENIGGVIHVFGSKIIAPTGEVVAINSTGTPADLMLVGCVLDTDVANPLFNCSVSNVIRLDGASLGADVTHLSGPALLDAIKTVDGPGSGLDADTVDGVEASVMLQAGDLPNTVTIPGASGRVLSGPPLPLSFSGNSTQEFGGYWTFSTAQVGYQLGYEFMLKPGTYRVQIVVVKAQTAGIAEWSLDGNVIGTTDTFNSSFLTNQSFTFTGVVVSGYKHLLTCTVTGKNASSFAFQINLSRITFTEE